MSPNNEELIQQLQVELEEKLEALAKDSGVR